MGIEEHCQHLTDSKYIVTLSATLVYWSYSRFDEYTAQQKETKAK